MNEFIFTSMQRVFVHFLEDYKGISKLSDLLLLPNYDFNFFDFDPFPKRYCDHIYEPPLFTLLRSSILPQMGATYGPR